MMSVGYCLTFQRTIANSFYPQKAVNTSLINLDIIEYIKISFYIHSMLTILTCNQKFIV